MALFNSQTASRAGILSGQSRKANPIQRVRVIQTTSTLALDKDVQSAVKRQLALVREQITSTRTMLNEDRGDTWCDECQRGSILPHHRAQLLKALDSLLERECDLLGIPGRGSRKPAPERSKPTQPGSALASD